ncbi:hypothetical protein FPV67DRAFT_1665040 [Lyophyllum atratum]|nr:hypothetical protein FPV67DRAFT_1665040 [Lyophyllum atratum]
MAFLFSLFKPLAYLSLPLIILRSIAATSATGRYYVRQGVYVGTLMTVAACSVVVAAGMSVVGRQFDVNYVVARTFYLLARNVLQVEIQVEGQEYLDTRPSVLMANHQTMLDILVVGRLMPKQTSIMAKKSLQYTPLGPFMTMSGAIFIDRGNSSRANLALDVPRRHTHELRGARRAPAQERWLPPRDPSRHPIIPIVTENYWRMYHKGVFDTGIIKVRVLPPISTTGLTTTDIPELTTRVRDQMLKTLREISAVPPGHSQKPEEEVRNDHSETSSIIPSLPSPGDASPTIASQQATSSESLGTGTSSASLASSFSVSNLSKSEMSENGADTEEDEGMILVGRPT